jgi:hypothetical protein
MCPPPTPARPPARAHIRTRPRAPREEYDRDELDDILLPPGSADPEKKEKKQRTGGSAKRERGKTAAAAAGSDAAAAPPELFLLHETDATTTLAAVARAVGCSLPELVAANAPLHPGVSLSGKTQFDGGGWAVLHPRAEAAAAAGGGVGPLYAREVLREGEALAAFAARLGCDGPLGGIEELNTKYFEQPVESGVALLVPCGGSGAAAGGGASGDSGGKKRPAAHTAPAPASAGKSKKTRPAAPNVVKKTAAAAGDAVFSPTTGRPQRRAAAFAPRYANGASSDDDGGGSDDSDGPESASSTDSELVAAGEASESESLGEPSDVSEGDDSDGSAFEEAARRRPAKKGAPTPGALAGTWAGGVIRVG